jgi:hypothetical protein
VGWVFIALFLCKIISAETRSSTVSSGGLIAAGLLAAPIAAGVYRWRRIVHPKAMRAEDAAIALRIAQRRLPRRVLQQWTYSR